MLCNQLLRTTNPEVIHIVVAELKIAIDAYTESFQQGFPVIDVLSLTRETA